MIRFIARETDFRPVLYGGDCPITRFVSFDGDMERLEIFLRFEDWPGERQPDHVTRELAGVELI